MPLSRAAKHTIVQEVTGTLTDAKVLILVHNKGMTVAEVSNLRGKMREAGASYRVVKNRLAKLAMKDTPYAGVTDMMKGPTVMATSADPVSTAKVLVDFAKTNDRLVVLGGMFGDRALDVKTVEALAKMPSLDQLRATLVGMLQTPATRIAAVLQAPGGQVARVISAYANKAE
jgi:large subunit ribosomal protein L10